MGSEASLKYELEPSRDDPRLAHALALSRYEASARRVGNLFHDHHDAYAKIFHTILIDEGHQDSDRTWAESPNSDRDAWWTDKLGRDAPPLQRVGLGAHLRHESARRLWADLLPEPLTASTDWRDLTRAFGGGSWPRWVLGPEEGALDPDCLAALLGVLAATAADLQSWMFVEGWEVLATRTPASIDSIVLATGPADAVVRFVADTGCTPRSWWSSSGRWAVFTDRDSCATFVAADALVVNALLADPVLEAVKVSSDDVAYPNSSTPDHR